MTSSRTKLLLAGSLAALTFGAAHAGKTLHEKVTVKQGHAAKALLLWPAGTGKSQGHGSRQ